MIIIITRQVIRHHNAVSYYKGACWFYGIRSMCTQFWPRSFYNKPILFPGHVSCKDTVLVLVVELY